MISNGSGEALPVQLMVQIKGVYICYNLYFVNYRLKIGLTFKRQLYIVPLNNKRQFRTLTGNYLLFV